MAFVLADRVKETTATTGTGTVTLAGAATGYQSFSAIGNANTTYYVIAGQGTAEWEVGIGTYTAAGTTLSRTTVLSSSNAGALVRFSAGTKDVFCDYPASKAAYQRTDQTSVSGTTGAISLFNPSVTVNTEVPAGLNGMTVGPLTIASGVAVTVATGSRLVVL